MINYQDEVDLHDDIEAHLNIDGDNILDSCESFPQGLKVGDRVMTCGYGEERVVSTVVSFEEWENTTDRPAAGDFTDYNGICTKDDAPYHGRHYWRNGWDDIEFVERSVFIEEDGQLLMF